MNSEYDRDNKRPVLVTGASGFVGGHLIRYLVSKGVRVRGMIRNGSKSGAVEKLGAEPVLADLRDAESLKRAVEGVKQVYHIAALFRQAGLPEGVYREVNAEGVRRLLEACVSAGVERVVHCSTVGVLGHVKNPPANEETEYNPGDIYQETKLEGERVALEYFSSGRMGGVVIRPAMIYGPGDTRMLKLFKMIARGRFFYVGRGRAYVHFIDVRDLARAFYLAMEKRDINGEVYIIAGRKAVPLCDMVNTVADYMGVKRPRVHLPARPVQWLGSLCEAICTPLGLNPPIYRRRVDFFTKDRWFDSSRAQRDLGFEPSGTFEEELADIVEWYRKAGWLDR
ncbi:MAG: SDR family NAD(P)-dependent oxidoreductase [Kiritimatiellia bacterium]